MKRRRSNERPIAAMGSVGGPFLFSVMSRLLSFDALASGRIT
jgi:hypothetical protein